MTRIALALAALLAAAPALADGTAPQPKARAVPAAAAPAVRGKAQAPVRVETVLGAGTAALTVHFDGAASDVSVRVYGVDGLRVTSDGTPISGARFAAGQSISFDVAFTPGPGQGRLAVSVGGQFSGSRRRMVSAFAVGTPTAEQRKAQGALTVDAEGNPVKVMPSQPR